MPLGWPSPADEFLRRNTQRFCDSTRGGRTEKSCFVRCKLCCHPFGFYENNLSVLGFNMNLEQRYDAFSLWRSGLMIPSCWASRGPQLFTFTRALHKACRIKQTHNGLLTVDQGCRLTRMSMKWNFPESDTLIDTLLEAFAGVRSRVS